MARKLKSLEIEEVSLVDDPANAEAEILLFKRNDGDNKDEGDANKASKAADEPQGGIMENTEKLQAELDKAVSENAELKAKVDELSKRIDEIENTEAEVEKRKLEALPESVRKRIEASEKKAADAEAEVAKMIADKAKAECVAKAKEISGVNADEMGPVLHAMGPEADAYGIMSTPLVVVGDEVVGRGKVVPAKRLAAIIQAKLGG